MTVKFYTDTDKYMGWIKNINYHYSAIRNWLRSGNYVIFHGSKITRIVQFHDVLDKNN